ncbi:DUF1775 domain-containing protein [Microlunatus sp. Gsoil 973]|nr:DUF1775 domain-containing protein [Microlunatus sp. Gsoil 973]
MLTAALGLMIIVGLPAAASAHIRVSATDATPGGYGLLTFRVPTESDTASTTEVIINFPVSTPITSVSVAPVDGWTARVQTGRLDKPVHTDDGPVEAYVKRVVWRADSPAGAIKPGEFGLFNLMAGPLPRTATVAFPTDQHYSDGTVVSWNQLPTGAAEPDHPAPVINLSGPATASPAPEQAVVASPVPGRLAVIGIAVAAVALVIAIIAVLRTRRPDA